MNQADKKNGRIHIGTVFAVLGIIGGPLAVWGDAQRDSGMTKQQITTIEKRQEEDRRDTRQNISEVKEHVKAIDSNVQVILQKITAMEVVQKSQRRERP